MQTDQSAASAPLVHTIKNTQARLGGASHSTIYRMIKSGQLEAIKIGDRTYILDKSITALIDRAPRLGKPSRRSR
jgi:excisionase family DNA binding protein